MSAKSILDMIRESKEVDKEETPRCPLSADDWQEFKRKFVEEYGGEKVQDTE